MIRRWSSRALPPVVVCSLDSAVHLSARASTLLSDHSVLYAARDKKEGRLDI